MAKFIKTGSCIDCSCQVSLFSCMTKEQLELVDKNRNQVVFKPGETIFKTGSPLTHILCLTGGMVKIYLEDPSSGKNILLSISKPIEMIGGPGFLVDDRHYITVVALEETTACFVRVEDYKDVIFNNPEFSLELIKSRNERIIKYFNKMLHLTYKQTHGKIADTLLYLSDEIYNSDTFYTPLTRQDMADMSSITKDSAIRVLKEFVSEGIIKCSLHDFEIINKELLKKISKTG